MKNRMAKNGNCLFLIPISCIILGLWIAQIHPQSDFAACLCIIGTMTSLACFCLKAKQHKKQRDLRSHIATKKAESL